MILTQLLAIELGIGFLPAFSQTASPVTFEVASIRPSNPGAVGLSITAVPGRFLATNASLKSLIVFAYDIPDSRLLGAPKFLDSARFDIVAKLPVNELPLEKLRPMVQALLGERFKLTVHRESRELSSFALMVDKNGPKITPVTDSVEGAGPSGMRNNGPGRWAATSATMAILANVLTRQTGVSVQDQTDLTGAYNFTLEWTPDSAASDDSNGQSLFTAIRDQLGLKLEPRKGLGTVVVIDHVETMPTEN